MFSSEGIVKIIPFMSISDTLVALSNVLALSTSQGEKIDTVNSWELLFKELSDTLYFKDHLSRQLKQSLTITIIFSTFISSENLISLSLLCKKFPFFNLVRLSDSVAKNDLVEDFLTQNASNTQILETSDLCILIGVNTRYTAACENKHVMVQKMNESTVRIPMLQ